MSLLILKLTISKNIFCYFLDFYYLFPSESLYFMKDNKENSMQDPRCFLKKIYLMDNKDTFFSKQYNKDT